MAANRRVARNADGHISYTIDTYGKIPKVGEVYSYDGKRVKCTGVSHLSPGYGGIDRYLIDADIVNAVARNATGAYKGWVSMLDSYVRFLGDIVSGGKGPKDSAEFKRLSEAADIIKKASAALSRY